MDKNIQPLSFHFKSDGGIPNSKLPLLLYHEIFSESGEDAAVWLEKRFSHNGWTNSWRWGIYDFHHFHSNTHEVLGVFRGSAQVQVGGENGQILDFVVGTIVVIPAGVGHKCISATEDFEVVGAYPQGAEPDLNRPQDGIPDEIISNIAQVELPGNDPLLGENGGLKEIWPGI